MQRNRLINTALFAVIGTLYCWAVLTTIIQFSYLQFDALPLLLLCLEAVCAFLLLSYNKRVLLVGSVTIAALIVIWLLLGLRSGWTSAFFSDLAYILRMIISVDDYNPLYNYQMMLVIVILLSAFVCFSLRTTYNFYLLTGFGVAMFCITLNESKPVGLEFPVLCFVLLTLLLAKLYVRYLRKKKLSSLCLGKYLLRALPLSLAVVLLASAVSIPFSGVEPASILRYDTFQEFIDLGLFNGSKKTSQFHKGEVNLGGDLNPTDTPVLRVTADQPLYLTGSINDEYTGHSWKQSQSEFNTYPTDVPTVDTATAMWLYGEFFPSYMHVRTLDITYLYEDYALFAPSKTLSISGLGDNWVYINNLGEFETNKRISENKSYQISYLINDLISQGQVGQFSENLGALAPDLNPNSFAVPVFNEQSLVSEYNWNADRLAEYALDLKETYTALPNSVTQRTRDLASQISEEYSGTAAKATAIRDYLVNNYTYSLSPGPANRGQDFVDQFLFDTKKGYCTSFASAMAVLCRSVGIPARYVEGYAMPAQQEADGSYLVKTRNAHAWAEIYLDQYGWVKMEATPPYTYAEESGEKPQILLDEDEKNPEDLQQNLEDLGIDPLKSDPNASSGDEIGVESQSSGADPLPDLSQQQSTTAGAPVGLIVGSVLFCLAAAAVALRIRRRKLRELPDAPLDAELARASFEQILKLASFSGTAIQPGETPLAFCQRLSAKAGDIPLEEAARLYSAQQYGGAELTQEQVGLIRSACCRYDTLVRAQSKSIRYLFYKYLLHRI